MSRTPEEIARKCVGRKIGGSIHHNPPLEIETSIAAAIRQACIEGMEEAAKMLTDMAIRGVQTKDAADRLQVAAQRIRARIEQLRKANP